MFYAENGEEFAGTIGHPGNGLSGTKVRAVGWVARIQGRQLLTDAAVARVWGGGDIAWRAWLPF